MLLLLLACTGKPADSADTSDTADSGGDSSSAVDVCGDTATWDTWEDGLSRVGDGSLLTFTIAAAEPSPPDKGDNVWTIGVSAVADGSPVSDETVTIAPFMPEHGHGTNPATVTTTSNGDGTYTSTSFNLFMGGLWQLTIGATGGAAGFDSAMFSFCILG